MSVACVHCLHSTHLNIRQLVHETDSDIVRIANLQHHTLMKGTAVPNPRRSSACDCTCVLIRNRTLSHDSLMLGMCILFCSCPCKFAHEFLTLFHRPCATYLLAFLADFTLSDSAAPIRFVVKLFSLANYTLLFVWIERQAMITAFPCFPSYRYRYSSFTLRAYLCSVGGTLPMAI